MKPDNTLIIIRTFDAPVEKVWAAWTEPEQLKKWWGPNVFTALSIRNDFREGGKYVYNMHGSVAPGEPVVDLYSCGIYKEIVPLKKIVATDSFSDADGNVMPASEYGLEGEWPDSLLVTTEFEDLGNGKTKLTLTHEGAPSAEHMQNMNIGWNESLDKLAKVL